MVEDNSGIWLSEIGDFKNLNEGEAVEFTLKMLNGSTHRVAMTFENLGPTINRLQQLANTAYESRQKRDLPPTEVPTTGSEIFEASGVHVPHTPSGQSVFLQMSSKDGQRIDIRLPTLLAHELATQLEARFRGSDILPPQKKQ